MTKPWTESYPPGVSTELELGDYSSVVDVMDESFRRFPDRVAYVCMGRELTFRQLDAASRALAVWLQEQGAKPGDRVAIMLPNILQFPVVLAGVLRAACVAVPVNPLYTARELQHQLDDSGATVAIVLENFAGTLEEIIGKTSVERVVVASMGDMLGLAKGSMVNFAVRHVKKLVPGYRLPGHVRFNAVLRSGKSGALKKHDCSLLSIAILQYTGGTTGVSKGAILLHRCLVGSMLASEQWMQPALQRKGLHGQATVMCALPLYHVFSLVACGLLGMRIGAKNILVPNPRDLNALIDAAVPHKIHLFPAVNTLYQALLAHPRFRELDFSELAIAVGGGMAVQSRVARDWLQATGAPVVEAYGLSETAAGGTSNRTDIDSFTGTIGLPVPGIEIRIVDDSGNEVSGGAPGEIAIKGPQVMAGYWRRRDDHNQVFTPDGYFKTGDIGIMDTSGFVRIVDRKKDMILVSGFNVYPNEIEEVVSRHPGVLECAAVGVPDEKAGEAVKVYIVKRDPQLAESDILALCSQHLTRYKQPRYIEFRDSLPKTNVGKILRRELRQPVAA